MMKGTSLRSHYKRIQHAFMLLMLAICAGIPMSLSAQYQVGNGTAALTGNFSPYADGWFLYKNHYLVLASELTAAGLASGDTLTSIAFQRDGNTSTTAWNNTTRAYSIGLKSTTLTSMPASATYAADPTSGQGFTTVFSNPAYSAPVATNVWITHTFSTPFVWNGQNLIVEVCSHRSGYTTGLNVLGTSMSATRTITTYNDVASLCGTTSLPTLNSSSLILPNMRFTIPPKAFDLAVTSLASPISVCPGTYPVSVTITNNGTNTWNFATNNATISGGTTGPNTTTFTPVVINSGTLAPGASQTVTLSSSYNMSAAGTHVFAATLTAAADQAPGNNVLLPTSRVVIAPLAMPAIENFNASTAIPSGWTTNMYTSTAAARGTSGNGLRQNVWSTFTSNLTLPTVGPATSIAYAEFYYRITNYSDNAATTLSGDMVYNVAVSPNCGTSFTNVFTINAQTHTPTTNWTRVRVPLAQFAGAPVQLRITGAAGSSGLDVWFDVDDFAIREPFANDAALAGFTSPVMPFNSGTASVITTLRNEGSTPLTSAVVNWTINGVAQTPATFSGNIAPNATAAFTLGNVNFTDTLFAIVATVATVNGVADPTDEGNTISTALRPAVQGSLTISTLDQLRNVLAAIAQGGALGNVVLNVTPGTYSSTATISLFAFPGASAQNTVTIQSASGVRSAIFENGNTVSPNQAVIRFESGASWYRLQNITARSLVSGSSTGYAVDMLAGGNNSITNCLLENTTSGTTTSNNVLRMSGVVTNTTVQNSTIRNGVWGINVATSTGSDNIRLLNNIVEDFDRYGIALSTTDNSLISGNEIRRPNKAVPVSSSTGELRFISTSVFSRPGNIIERNYIHTAVGLAANTVSGIFGSSAGGPAGFEMIIRNNVITNFASNNDVRGIENWANSGVFVYNNTIRFTESATGTGGVFGLVMSSTSDRTDWRNNIVTIAGTGSKNKVGMAMTSLTSTFPNVNNNLYHVVGGTNTFVGAQISFSSTGLHTVDATVRSTTIEDWRTRVGFGRESNSVAADPLLGGTAPNFTLALTSPAARSGVNLKTLVPNDFAGVLRTDFFDMGANISPATALVNASINFGNTGRQLEQNLRVWNTSAVSPVTVTSWTNSNTTDFTVNGPASFTVPANGFIDVPVRYGIAGQTRQGNTTATFTINSGVSSNISFTGFYSKLNAVIAGNNAIGQTYNFGVALPGESPRTATVTFSPDVVLGAITSIQISNIGTSGDVDLFRLGETPVAIANNTDLIVTFTPPVSGGFGRKAFTVTIIHSGANSPTVLSFEANVGVPQVDAPATVNVQPVRFGTTAHPSAYANVTLIKLSKIGLVSPIIFQTPTLVGTGGQFEVLTNGGRGFVRSASGSLTDINNWSSTANFEQQNDYFVAVRLRAPGTTTLPGNYSQRLQIARGNTPANSTLITDVFVDLFGVVEPENPATAEIYPLLMDFGSVPVSQEAQRTITLRNNGNTSRTVSLTLSNQSAPYRFSNGLRSMSVTIGGGQMVEVAVIFAPTVQGSFSTNVIVGGGLSGTIVMNGTGSSFSTPVDNGTVTLRRGLASGEMLDATSTVSFGSVNVGSGASELVYIVNTRNTPITVNNIGRAGMNPSQFLVSWTPVTIPANGSYGFLVSFAPTSEGMKHGILNVFTSEGIRSTQLHGTAVSSGGTGVGGAVGPFALQQSTMNFGSVIVGSSASRFNSIENGRSTAVWVDTVLIISSFGSTEWSVLSWQAGAGFIQPNSSRTVGVDFAPIGSSGGRTATLVVVAQGGNLIRTSTLSATALSMSGRMSGHGNSVLEIMNTVPNPAVSASAITFRLGQAAQRVVTRLYDASGRVVGEVERASLRSGEHRVELNLSGLPSGGYFVIVEADGVQASTGLQIVK